MTSNWLDTVINAKEVMQFAMESSDQRCDALKNLLKNPLPSDDPTAREKFEVAFRSAESVMNIKCSVLTEHWYVKQNIVGEQTLRTACFQAALDYIYTRDITDLQYDNDYLCVIDGVVAKQGTLAECKAMLEIGPFVVAYINLIEQISGESSWKYFDINKV